MSTSPISAGASAPIANAKPVACVGGRPCPPARVGDALAGLAFGTLARRGHDTGLPDASAEAASPPNRAARGVDERGCASGQPPAGEDLVVDPLAVALASPHAGTSQPALGADAAGGASGDAVAMATRVSLEQMLSRLVRRIAWSGDARTGSARIEFGAGELEGATLVIHSDNGQLSVLLDLPPGVDRAAWRERIATRLGARGLSVASLDVE